MNGPEDFTGREIKVGDTIIYATLLGRSAALSRGEVIELIEGNTAAYSNSNWTLKVQRQNPDGSIVMESIWKYDKHTGTGEYGPEHPARPSRLRFPDRVVVIS